VRHSAKHLSIIGLWLSLVALAAPAQPYSSWAFIGNGNAAQPMALGAVDLSGNLSTIMLQTALPSSAFVNSVTMDADNRTYVLAMSDTNQPAGFIRVDAGGNVLNTFRVTNAMTITADVTLDTNGDYIVLESVGASTFTNALYRVDRSGNVTATLWMPSGFFPSLGVTLDGDTGDYLVGLRGFTSNQIFRVKPNGSGGVLAGTTNVPLRNQLAFERRNGNTVIGAWPNAGPGAAVLLSMSGAGAVTTILASGLNSGECVHPERASAANYRYIVGSDPPNSGIFFVDGQTTAITTLHASQSYVYRHVAPNRGRNIGVIQRTPTRWELNLNFPGEAGLTWAIGLSVTGTRPAAPIPGGRNVPIAIDPITVASVSGLLTGVLIKNAGTLDVNDNDTTFIDVTGLGIPSVNVWAVVLTLDPNAPNGIRTIADSVLIKI